MPIILQYLAHRGGFDPDTPNIKGCNMQDTLQPCHVAWINTPGGIPVSSMLLYVQSIAFSIQFFLFTTFSSLADYGHWNRFILLCSTVIGCLFQALPITLVNDDGTHWNIMMAIMCIALISYGTTLAFYAAAFPNLSDNLPIVRYAKVNPNLSNKEKELVIERWRNHISAISTTFSNIGFLVTSGALSGVSFLSWEGKYDFPPGVEHVLGNAPVYNFISTVVCAGFWAINAIPYFVWTPRGRRGPPLPEGAHYLTFGWQSIIQALREARKLRYLFMYILAYFMFSDAVSTIGQMSTIIQGELTGFSPQQNVIFGLVTAITSILGCLFFLWMSQVFKIRTKTSLLSIVVLTGLVPVWGCFGIYFDQFGIKTHRELWVLNVWQGLFTAPIWAWQQTMLAELVPKGKENLFFGLASVVNKASSWIGPVVIGAITQSTSNIWKGWPFVLGLFVLATFILCFIDVDKAKLELTEYEKNVDNFN
ncbi:autophagy-related protein 22-like protein [Gilbertella persicaria]|uniref:autophagy-related protein 22-like protein n=1 Tax=Gilbertella persicaria TaxID=101096 RepID=UPI00221E6170|nr:autophagy-related protein 22-like protein [Gilbertella persicaria]KAI8080174.1 autophagy-related protein 22-like protein [Gilbertella persicaria]